MKFATKAIHSGSHPEEVTGAIMPPIYMTSTYVQESFGEGKGYEYTRAHNPNFTILENLLAALEDAKYATVFSSGLGALTSMISMLSQGDKVVAMQGLYGGTYRLFNQIFSRFGIHFYSIDPRIPGEVDKALSTSPKWLLFETPTNPLLDVFDIELLTKKAKGHGVHVIVDNTFASPYCQNPLHYGVDAVWHSTTKYIGGHSDVLGGVVMTNSAEFKEKLDFGRKALGTNPSPFDVWLITRGVKTLALRMDKHQQNAMAVATFLKNHPKVKKVYYPGLPTHPNHGIAKKQMRSFGGMVSVEFNLPLDAVKKLVNSLNYFALAESLGGVESLICHPASMTHASIPFNERERIGITNGLIRISVGIEDQEDLIADLENALSASVMDKQPAQV